MLRLPLALLPVVLLSGCATGYAVDYVRPKMFLLGPQLARYGLDKPQSECVGASLSTSLSVWQMRQLSEAARAVPTGGAYPAELKMSDLVWVAAHVKDPEVGKGVARAADKCGLSGVSMAKAENSPVPAASAPEPSSPTQEPPPPPPGLAAPAPETSPPAPAATDLTQEQLLAIFNKTAAPPSAQNEPAPPPPTIQNEPVAPPPSEEARTGLEAYEHGDFAAAASLLKIAAEQGDGAAQEHLGELYLTGKGVKKDLAAAARYYSLAAEQGRADAMNSLGKAYETGQGVPRDPINALKWYLLASARPTRDQGEVEANIQNVSGSMSLAQIEDAGELVREWERARRQ